MGPPCPNQEKTSRRLLAVMGVDPDLCRFELLEQRTGQRSDLIECVRRALIFSRPVQQKAVALCRALQHVLNQQVPAHKPRKDLIFRLFRGRRQAFTRFRVVTLVH